MKAKTKPKTKPNTKRGAKAGNQNARKHGLWAKNHAAPKTSARMSPEDRMAIIDEIIIDLRTTYYTTSKLNQRLSIANIIFYAVIAATSCDRLILLRDGKSTPMSDAIEKLLMEEDPHDARTIEH